jgi:hypothetical protein
MNHRDTKEILYPAETGLAANVVQFPVVGPLRPKPRCKPQELPGQGLSVAILPPPVTMNHVLPGRMKRSGQPLQVWTSPYRKVPPRPIKSEIARNYIKSAIAWIKSATKLTLQELVRLHTQGWALRFVARFRHST